jgi:hypothetical protein
VLHEIFELAQTVYLSAVDMTIKKHKLVYKRMMEVVRT